MIKPDELPAVEKGIPIPPPEPPRKKRKQRYNPPTPWIAFLKQLQDRDSFKTYFSSHCTVKKYLRELGISFEFRWIKNQGQPHGRFWITHTPYTPEDTFPDRGLNI